MKAYVINMKRSVHRRDSMGKHLRDIGLEYELIEAIDGNLLPGEHQQATGTSLNRSETGCALSHRKVYELIQQRDNAFALILEDDILITEKDINGLLDRIQPLVTDETVTLLTYFWLKDKELPLRSKKDIGEIKGNAVAYRIYDALAIEGLGRAGAYIVSKECAKRLLDFQSPQVKCRADEWEVYDQQGVIQGVDCLYPRAVTENTQHGSEINYTKNSIELFAKKIISWTIYHKVPLLADLLRKRRKTFADRFKNVVLEN